MLPTQRWMRRTRTSMSNTEDLSRSGAVRDSPHRGSPRQAESNLAFLFGSHDLGSPAGDSTGGTVRLLSTRARKRGDDWFRIRKLGHLSAISTLAFFAAQWVYGFCGVPSSPGGGSLLPKARWLVRVLASQDHQWGQVDFSQRSYCTSAITQPSCLARGLEGGRGGWVNRAAALSPLRAAKRRIPAAQWCRGIRCQGVPHASQSNPSSPRA